MNMSAALSSFELAIMVKLLDGDDPVLLQLRNQLDHTDVVSRDSGQSGFYVDFQVPSGFCRVDDIPDVKSEFSFGDVQAKVDGNEVELGFLLWVKNGYLDCLEGYSYGEETIPSSIESFTVAYIEDSERDIEALRNQWIVGEGVRVADSVDKL